MNGASFYSVSVNLLEPSWTRKPCTSRRPTVKCYRINGAAETLSTSSLSGELCGARLPVGLPALQELDDRFQDSMNVVICKEFTGHFKLL